MFSSVRALAVIFAALAALAAVRESADAFQYCPVSVGAVQALQFGASDAYRRAYDHRFGVELRSEESRTAAVELSIAASGEIYRVTFPALALAAGGSAAVFFAFDRPKAVDYVWISKVSQGSSSVDCPLDPFRASHEYFNDRRLPRTELAARLAANERLLAAGKDASMLHPEANARIHRDCATPEQTPTIKHEVPPDGGDLTVLKGPTPVVALVHVSPAGEPLDVQLVQSSAFPRLNAAVLTSAKTSTYYPATIDCMPSMGVYLFKALFGT